MSTKIYHIKDNTHYSSIENHILIRHSYKCGLTGVKITWGSALVGRYGTRGYVIECDQIKWARIGNDIKGAIKSISDLVASLK